MMFKRTTGGGWEEVGTDCGKLDGEGVGGGCVGGCDCAGQGGLVLGWVGSFGSLGIWGVFSYSGGMARVS